MESIGQMKVAELKTHLKQRNLSTSGNKPELIVRLEEYLVAHPSDELMIEHAIFQPSAAVDEGDDDILQDEDKILGIEPTNTATKVPDDPISIKSGSANTATSSVPPPPTTAGVSIESEKATPAPAAVLATSPSSDNDKRLARAERFGVAVSSDTQKIIRAQRFGIPVPAESDQTEKLKSRADRFGLKNGSGIRSEEAAVAKDPEKLKKRAERFGLPEQPPETVSSEVLKRRAERFSDSLDKITVSLDEIEEKKRKRADRFQT